MDWSISWFILFVQFWLFFFLGSAFRAANSFLGWGRHIPNRWLGMLTDWSWYRIILTAALFELLPLPTIVGGSEGMVRELILALGLGVGLGTMSGKLTRLIDRRL